MPQLSRTPDSAGRVSSRSRAGQAILEFLLIGVAVVLGLLMAAGPVSQAVRGLLEGAGEREQEAATTLASLRFEGMPPWAGEHAQGEPELAEDEEDGPIVVATGPTPGGPGATPPSPIGGGGGLGGGGGGGGGISGGSGTGGSAGGGAGGTGSGPVVDGGGGGPLPEPVEPEPGIIARSPNTAEQTLLDAARNLLLTSAITFDLFDFTLGQAVTHAVAQAVNNISLFGVPTLVADLRTKIGALAAVFFQFQSDGTVDFSQPVYLVFDERVLATFTKEKVAAVMAHEGWHVNQVFNGILNDFANYPRVVDIEYEAFVAGAAVWDATKGTQTEPLALDPGSACVASGEARCKEILATNFGYSTGPRRG